MIKTPHHDRGTGKDQETCNVPKSELDDLLSHANILAERREKLCKAPPLCPDCKTDQVQLTEWIEGEVAEWKCRLSALFERVVLRRVN
jgi:hypothetical protein